MTALAVSTNVDMPTLHVFPAEMDGEDLLADIALLSPLLAGAFGGHVSRTNTPPSRSY